MKIYLAHPISGLSFDQVMQYYDPVQEALEKLGYEVFTPMVAKDHLRGTGNFVNAGYNDPISNNHSIMRRDHWMVHQADIVYVNLLPVDPKDLLSDYKVSIGSMFELAWAYHAGKHTIVAKVNKGCGNYEHAFIQESADLIFDDHESAMNYLERLAGEERSEKT